MVERPRRRRREEEKDRLRAEGRQHRGAAKPVEPGVAAAEEAHEPPDGEPHVERHVGDVEDGDDAASREEKGLQLRLDVNSEAPLERDDSLRVARSPALPILVHDEVADGEVDGVDAEADRDFTPSREPPHQPPLPIAADILID